VSPQKLAVAISALCNLLRGNAEGVSELFVDQCYSANAAVAHAYFQARRLKFALHLSLCTSLTCTQSLPSSAFPVPMHSHLLKRICNMPYRFREMQAVLEVYATHDIAIRPHVLLALVLYKVVDQVTVTTASTARWQSMQTEQFCKLVPEANAVPVNARSLVRLESPSLFSSKSTAAHSSSNRRCRLPAGAVGAGGRAAPAGAAVGALLALRRHAAHARRRPGPTARRLRRVGRPRRDHRRRWRQPRAGGHL